MTTVYQNLKTPKVLFETSSKFADLVQVVQVGKTTKLYIDDALNSIKYDAPSISRLVWGEVPGVIFSKFPDLKSALFLGLGAGTMQKLVMQKYPDVKICTVEIDEKVIEIADKYFGVRESENHKIIVEDALRAAVEPSRYGLKDGQFQICVVDILDGIEFPDLAETGNFIAHIKRLVSGGGYVLFIRVYKQEFQEDVNFFVDNLNEFFTSVETQVVPGYSNSDHMIITCGV